MIARFPASMRTMTSRHAEFASEDVKRLLVANGLCDLQSAFELGKPLDDVHEERATRHEFKRVVKLDLSTPTGPTSVYIKRQWKRARLLPRPTDLRHGIAVKCSPIHEWRGLRIMQEAGFHVSEPLALFWQGWGFARGAVVTRAVPPEFSLADLILSGEFEAMSGERRDSLIAAAAGVVARLHHARISWRSRKAKHFYPEETAPGAWRIWLIDCEGVSKRATKHDCQCQWSAFLKYITTWTPALREAFLSAYLLSL